MKNLRLFPDALPAGPRFTALPVYCAVAVFAAAIFVFSAYERKVDVLAEENILRFKYNQMVRGKLPEVVFLGNSMILHGVIPKLLSEVDDDGCWVNSYNAGASGMDIGDALYLIDAMRQNPRRSPEYVVAEVTMLLRRIGVLRNERQSWVYRGPDMFYPAWLAAHMDEATLNSKLTFLYNYALNTIRVGEMANMVLERKHEDRPPEPVEFAAKSAGFVSYEDRQEFTRPKDDSKPPGAEEYSFGPIEKKKLDLLIKAIRSIRSKPVLMFSPLKKNKILRSHDQIRQYIQRVYPDIAVLDMSLDEVPMMDKDWMWADNAHLNEGAARIYTALLKWRVCDLLGRGN